MTLKPKDCPGHAETPGGLATEQGECVGLRRLRRRFAGGRGAPWKAVWRCASHRTPHMGCEWLGNPDQRFPLIGACHAATSFPAMRELVHDVRQRGCHAVFPSRRSNPPCHRVTPISNPFQSKEPRVSAARKSRTRNRNSVPIRPARVFSARASRTGLRNSLPTRLALVFQSFP